MMMERFISASWPPKPERLPQAAFFHLADLHFECRKIISLEMTKLFSSEKFTLCLFNANASTTEAEKPMPSACE